MKRFYFAGAVSLLALCAIGFLTARSETQSRSVNVVVEGDSIGAGLFKVCPPPESLVRRCTMVNVAVPGSYIGPANVGGEANILSRYETNVRPHRPEQYGGNPGVREAWLMIVIGTNNLPFNELESGSVPGFKASLEAYLALARRDGFKLAISTVYAGAGFNDGLGQPMPAAAAQRAADYNKFIKSSGIADLVIPLDVIIPGVDDPGVSPDKLHLSPVGYARFGEIVRAAFPLL